MIARTQPLTVLTCGCLLLLGAGCICVSMFRPTTPVLHKPSPCDLDSVLTLQLPERVDTLGDVPRTETFSQGGTNSYGGPLPDGIKEHFCLTKGATEYRFIVFHTEAAAVKEYGRDSDRNVFRETTENGLTGRVHYTEEPRADGEGGRVPMGYYISRADFRLHNLYIRVETKAHEARGEKPQNDKLANAVRDLAQMLSASIASTHQRSK
jgi:hypothetical protein